MCSQLHDPLYYGEGMGTGAKGMASSLKVWEWSCKDNVGLQDPKAKAKLTLTRTGKTGTKYVNYANSSREWHNRTRLRLVQLIALHSCY